MVRNAGCREFERELAAYLEGEHRPSVADHAMACPFCAAVVDDLNQILFASRELSLEEPPARVWASVRATLAQEGLFREVPSGWQEWFFRLGIVPAPAPIAVLAALFILGAAFLIPPKPRDLTSNPNRSSVRLAAVTELPHYLNEENDLARTLKGMEESYRAQQTALDPGLQAIYEKSLKSLDNSIIECRDSVRREPSNDLAHEYLLNAYAQKAELLASALEFEGR